MEENTRVCRVYGDFRGVDLRGQEVSLLRSPDSLNMWKDYRALGGICTRPAMELHTPFDAPVYGVFFYNQMILVHSGDRLYRLENGVKTELTDGLRQARSCAFVYEGIWYFKDGGVYLRYDGETLAPVEGYVPTTSMGRAPEGGGTAHEDVNLLSDYRKNSFLADGGAFDFYLDTAPIDSDYEPQVWVDGVLVAQEAYVTDHETGKITFLESAPDAPGTDGQDNVVVKFKKAVAGYREAIEKCTLAQLFDNRVFFSGNEAHPNYVWHTALNDPTYCSDLDYYREGQDPAAVRGLVAGNNALWVFREPSDANTTVFYHTPVLDESYGKIYPAVHSSIATGCVGAAVNFGDDILFFSRRGMEGISGDVTTEQAARHRSSLVDRALTSELDYENMILAEWEGYLMVFTGRRVYLADSRRTFQEGGSREYEWFLWELPQAVTCAAEKGGVLYLGTAEGLCTLTDRTAPVESWWVTSRDRFGYPNRRKTTNKRSCLAECAGDVTVQVSVDGGEFQPVGAFEAVTDRLTARVKRKKFKDIQLKFHSNTRFSLELITLEAFVAGYVK